MRVGILFNRWKIGERKRHQQSRRERETTFSSVPVVYQSKSFRLWCSSTSERSWPILQALGGWHSRSADFQLCIRSRPLCREESQKDIGVYNGRFFFFFMVKKKLDSKIKSLIKACHTNLLNLHFFRKILISIDSTHTNRKITTIIYIYIYI